MLNVWLVACASLAWLAVMFGVALYAERRPGDLAGRWRHVYVLSLAVHCTSWTFYGTATQVVRHGWLVPPALLGVIAFHVLAAGFLLRLVRLSRETRATSLADLIATRLGRDAWLAAIVTFVALLGLIPYIGLQLRAVSMSFSTVTASDQMVAVPLWGDGALYVALAMAVFAMLFGARRADANGHNRGLVLAMAFESFFKLVAMLVLGGLAWVALDRLPAETVPPVLPSGTGDGYVPLLLLGFVAVFVLPHQFHMGVIECRNERDVRTARWMFPLYLLLIALPAVPLALAGSALLGDGVASDMYALALPLAQGHEGIALFVFLGGLSAATGMVVVSTLTLSLMIGNHWLMPGLLYSRKAGIRDVGQRSNLLRLRRSGIVVIMLAAWAYSRFLSGGDSLADAGATSFSVLSTLAPALCLAVWWPRTPAHAVRAGILAGVATWAWISLLPVIAVATGRFSGLLADGPLGIALLSPDNFFGLGNWSVHGRAFGASLFVNLLVVLAVALHRSQAPEPAERELDRDVLEKAGLRFLASKRVSALLTGAPEHGPVPKQHERRMERELSGVLGAASARLLLDAARHPRQELDTVAAIVSEASQELRFNQQMLMAALRNMSQGVSVIDGGLRLVAWNPRYVQLFDFPDDFLQIGKPIEDVIRWTLERMPHRGSEEEALTRRLIFMRAGTPHLTERVFPDGSIIEIRGNPMPGGGFVATYTDITVSRDNERELKRINETLEQRVAERTALLESAKREAEHANDAKSRFLTAIGHDLLQPLHAAHLFTDALAQQMPGKRDSIEQLRGALDSTTDLLNGLLDMSRLEAGGLLPEPRDFPLVEVLDPLASEFRALAGERGLSFTYLPTRAWTYSDPQLLRRILQNFLANAVRYTRAGGIVFGVRRAHGGLRVEVHDTGPGIGSEEQQAIFEEFRRGVGAPGQGLGLGLSIADRIAKLLQAPLSVRSRLGRGSVFAVELPLRVSPVQRALPAGGRHGLAGKHVLAVDNDPLALSALEQLLRGWGCEVEVAGNGEQAEAALARMPADVWLFDYHLDEGDTGVELWKRLSTRFGSRPCLILSADQSGEVRRSARDADLPMISKPVRPLALKSVLDRVLAASASAT